MIKTDYDKQTENFLQETGVKFEAKFLYHGPYFEEETESRDIYEITLTREGKKRYSFRFGQSIANSGLVVKRNPYGRTLEDQELIPRRFQGKKQSHLWMHNPQESDRVYPSAYDVLSCLTKYDPGTFAEFCSDFGYDTDSRKAEKTYFAVQDEYANLKRIFSQEELEKMQEIQ